MTKHARPGDLVECYICHEIKPYTDELFGKENGHRCRACSNAHRIKNWREEQVRKGRIVGFRKRKHPDEHVVVGHGDRPGIKPYRSTVGEVRAIRSRPCEICGNTKNIFVDHCHTTGKIRGGLCNTCNALTGYLEKHRSRLRAAVAYLNKHGVK